MRLYFAIFSALIMCVKKFSAHLNHHYHTEFQNIDYCLTVSNETEHNKPSSTESVTKETFVDPIIEADKVFNRLLFGKEESRVIVHMKTQDKDPMVHFPSGSVLRISQYGNKSAAHMPELRFMYPGHCRLKLTHDYMQTALNAFAIFAYGTIDDIHNLPRNYIMVSARTIAMIKICNEKLAAVWKVFKGDLTPRQITHEMLQLYRPLFQYVSAREMAELNLIDDRILSYIGTHPQLTRHQVAIIAKKYIKMNLKWATPRYMNIMNNLLCGVPMSYMREIDDSFFLRLTLQVFYHIYACDPLQRRFYLIKMTKTTALGKPYSWSARDVSRLGLLLAEVSGPDLSTINPTSMVAISAQVMVKMAPENLRYITEAQLKHIQKKSLNILSHKLTLYKKLTTISRASLVLSSYKCNVILIFVLICY